MKKSQFLIATPSLIQHDAVSNDVLIQKETLENAGHEVFIFTQYNHLPKQPTVKGGDLDLLLKSKSTQFIYHHSFDWEDGLKALKSFKGRLFVKYHNVTPPEFFSQYDQKTAMLTAQGRRQTADIVALKKTHLYMADSVFNAQELIEVGAEKSRIRIVPPFHRVPEFGEQAINKQLAKKLRNNGRIKLLFVGRVSPNKGHCHLIAVVKRYLEIYQEDIEIHVVGGMWNNDFFLRSIERTVNEDNLSGHVFFHQQTSFRDLKTYYQSCDLFLLMSEHEGFCVPIIEAQFNDLPLIALNRTAVGETIGVEQIAFDELDYSKFAAAIHTVYHDKNYRDYLIDQGRKNIKRFEKQAIAEQLLSVVTEG